MFGRGWMRKEERKEKGEESGRGFLPFVV